VSQTESETPIRMVCIFAVPRTGSSHLTRLLRNCEAFNVKSELFHSGQVGLRAAEREALRAAAGDAAIDERSLSQWRRRNSGRTLEILSREGGGRPLFFKLFPGHQTKNQVKEQIFSRADVGYLILRRRPIECFISSLKAQYFGSHGKVDTTKLKPTLAAAEFADWARKTKDWYDWAVEELQQSGQPHLELTFEKELEGLSSEAALKNLLEGLSEMGLPDVALPKKIAAGERQDKEGDYRKRVANWAEFEAEVKADPAHAELLEWAEALPRKELRALRLKQERRKKNRRARRRQRRKDFPWRAAM
jgi:hypothetical protein